MQFWPIILISFFFVRINCQVNESSIQDVSSEVSEASEASESFRLPRKILPKEYFIKILPHDLGNLTYEGWIKIILFVVEPTSEIFLHQGFDLALGDEAIKVIRNNSEVKEDVRIVDIIYTIATQIVSYKVDKVLNAEDTVVFSATFSGLFVTNTQGLNHLDYVDTDGIKKRVLSTYFQPSGARQVFPCLDEPDLKAKFTLQVARREGETVLSNMIVNQTIPDERNSLTWVEFQKSVPMSTYLLAFVVCDFDRLRRRGGHQKIVRVWARRDALRQSDYAADLAADVLGWHEAYTGVEFPLQKLDLVSLSTYPVSGMENYGLIITQEVSSGTKDKLTRSMWVSTVVAHEVAHQWAGNLVTPMWWSEFWLSEGIATFLAALALDELRPFLQAMNHLTVETVSLVKRNDVSDEGSTLLQPHFNPLTNQLRDVYIYYKGAAILKMIESMVGRETFKKGLRGYFSKHKYQSVTQNDFFNVIEQALDRKSQLPEPLHLIMKNWTEAKSYPIVTVERNLNNQLSIKQIPFRKHNNVRKVSLTQPEDGTLWWVPISLATSSKPDFFNKSTKLWIQPSRKAVSLNAFVGANDTWVVLNVQQSAYIRVNYDTQTWKAISKQLYAKHEVIHMLNRAQLIDDAFQLFLNNRAMAHVPFEIISYLSRERSYFPFKSLFDNLKRIELLLRGEPEYPLLKKYILSLIAPLMSESLGDDNVNRKLKNYILSWACVLRHEQCAKLAQQQFQDWKKTNDDSVFPEFTSESFLCAAVEWGDVSDWDVVYGRYLSQLNSTSEMKDHLMNALSCTKNQNVILRYFHLIENSSNGLTEIEARDIFNSLVRSHNWADLTWTHLIYNMKSLHKRFDADPVPFVNTNRDLNYLKLIIDAEQKDQHLAKYYKDFLKENEESVRASTLMIHEVSMWLKRAMSS